MQIFRLLRAADQYVHETIRIMQVEEVAYAMIILDLLQQLNIPLGSIALLVTSYYYTCQKRIIIEKHSLTFKHSLIFNFECLRPFTPTNNWLDIISHYSLLIKTHDSDHELRGQEAAVHDE